MADPAILTRPGTIDHLPEMLAFLEQRIEAAGLDMDVAFAFQLAVEEVCTNVIKHGYAESGQEGPVTLSFHADDEQATAVITDRAPPFDPSSAPPPDLDSPWEERRIGGLGWHLVNQVMDEVCYDAPPDGGNRVTLVKHLSDSP